MELLSKDSGLTINTLMKLNASIVNKDLIYEGNIIYFGDDNSVIVKDSQNNIIATSPLTDEDKIGIKRALTETKSKADTSDSSTSDSSTSGSSTSGSSISDSSTSDGSVAKLKK
ncbi:hypothetical protein JNUCC83_09735 [Vagococcus sp. JNUCC 83]